MQKFLQLVLILLVLIPGTAAIGATLGASVSVRNFYNCDDSETSQVFASAFCGADLDYGVRSYSSHAEATAEYGKLGGRVSVGVAKNGVDGGGARSGSASFGASFTDRLFFDGLSDGVMSFVVSTTGGFNPKGTVYGMQLSLTSMLAGQVAFREAQALNTFDDVIRYTQFERVATIDVPFSDGYLYLMGTFGGRAWCGSGALEGHYCDVAIEVLHSSAIIGATVFDMFGNEVTDPSITSESGFDYITGYVEMPLVPLPSAGLLMLGGLTALGGLRARRHLGVG